MISIICASNNKNILENMLKKSLEKQTYQEYELIVINAKEKGFKSASETLNYGASISKGEVLVFIHQDIEFITTDGLEKINQYCKENDFAIAGVCGVVSTGEYKIYSSVKMGFNKRQAGIKNTNVMDIYALDECMLIIKKNNFKKFEDYGNTWHFYGVEYSIRANYLNERVLLFPIEIYHLSSGWSLDYSYFDTLKKIANKFKNEKQIKTCMGIFNNDWTLKYYCIYRKLKLLIKKILKCEKKD